MSEEKKGFFSRLVSGLTKTRDSTGSGIDAVFNGFSHIDDEFYEHEMKDTITSWENAVSAIDAVLTYQVDL